MLNLNDTNTWVGLIVAPFTIGGVLDLFVKKESKERFFARMESLSLMLSRRRVIYGVGFLASVATGLACIHVAGFTQKIDVLGGWWTATQSAAPIALFLVFKASVADPLFFWGSGRLYATLKGNDAQGRTIPRAGRWFIMGLLLLGACILTQGIFSSAESVQESSLRKIIPAAASVKVPDSEPTAKAATPAGVPESESPSPRTTDVSVKKPFDIRNLLTSFSMVIADFYAHAFLILNGVACFMVLIGFVRIARWCSSHIDLPMLPKFLFTAMSFVAAVCIGLLLVGYKILESL